MMKIHFLGTAAAEGWPAVFCRCEACQRARKLGGKNIRSRAGAIVDDVLKIDFGPDTYMQTLRDGIDMSRIEHIVFTHTHHDHLLPGDIDMFQPPYAWENPETLHVYAHDKVIQQVSQAVNSSSDKTYRYHLLQPFRTFQAADFQITPLLADHDPTETCLVYVIERAGETLLWGHDSGYFPFETWEWLEKRALNGTLSYVVLDCTLGPLPGMKGHMGIDGVLAVKNELARRKVTGSSTIFVATHFSHNGKWMHEELEAKLNPLGVEVAYDGWVLNSYPSSK